MGSCSWHHVVISVLLLLLLLLLHSGEYSVEASKSVLGPYRVNQKYWELCWVPHKYSTNYVSDILFPFVQAQCYD